MFSQLMVTAAAAGDRWHGGDGPPGFWPLFPIAWFLILATAAVVGFLVLRRNRAEAPRRAGEARLAELFAVGELDAEEYHARLSVLREK